MNVSISDKASPGVCFPGVPEDTPLLSCSTGRLSGNTIRIVFGGDTGFSGKVCELNAKLGYEALFHDIAPAFRAADLSFLNLEAPVSASHNPEAMFLGELDSLFGLAHAGVKVVNMASSHIADHGPEVLNETYSVILNLGIIPIGIAKANGNPIGPIFSNLKGFSVAWFSSGQVLGKDFGGLSLANLDEDELVSKVRDTKGKADLILVGIHDGAMLMDYPFLRNVSLAKKLAAVGADLIFFHHSHVVQGITKLENSLVLYSLGNFLWDVNEGFIQKEPGYSPQMEEEQRNSALFSIEFDRFGNKRMIAAPITLTDEGLKWLDGEKARKVLLRLEMLSRQSQEGDTEYLFDRQYIQRVIPAKILEVRSAIRRGHYGHVWYLFTRIRLRHIKTMLKGVFFCK